ncbi:MAG: AraC family transcriptional regulator [Candidatus Thiodiazotropha sp. (ex Dulcina madagascariensis)]|nr:AraC family transcriptional regulator [Candidatus Thiodiazotropha sp. (ex Dulcina madagascariensis)]
MKHYTRFDVLGDVLDTLRFRGTIFFRSTLAAPWGLSLDAVRYPRFHISMAGDFFICPETAGRPVKVREMEAVMLPTGEAHWVADRPGRRLVASAQASEACELGKPVFQRGRITNSLMCGLVRFDEQTTHPLLNALPEVIHIPHIEASTPVWRLIELIDAEASRAGSVNDPSVDRLSEILFLKLLQEFIKGAGEAAGFITALRDPRLHAALQLIHRRMHENWTIDEFAQQARMSRSTLVRRFREAIGVPPIEYLGQWRLLKAHSLLKYSAHSLEEIAERTGFASRQTLTKAFKRRYGYTPMSLRHRS